MIEYKIAFTSNDTKEYFVCSCIEAGNCSGDFKTTDINHIYKVISTAHKSLDYYVKAINNDTNN